MRMTGSRGYWRATMSTPATIAQTQLFRIRLQLRSRMTTTPLCQMEKSQIKAVHEEVMRIRSTRPTGIFGSSG